MFQLYSTLCETNNTYVCSVNISFHSYKLQSTMQTYTAAACPQQQCTSAWLIVTFVRLIKNAHGAHVHHQKIYVCHLVIYSSARASYV